MDRATAERLQVGDRVSYRGGIWTIEARLDRGKGYPHFRLRNEDDGQTEGLTAHEYLDTVELGEATRALLDGNCL